MSHQKDIAGKRVIMGAGGHAREVLDCLVDTDPQKLFFFDNSADTAKLVYGKFSILKQATELRQCATFFVGVGGVEARATLAALAEANGLVRQGIRGPFSLIGDYHVNLHASTDVMAKVTISSSVSVGAGTLLNQGAALHHDVVVGENCEIGPRATLLGRVKLGSGVTIGAGALLLPKVIVGDGSTVGAGAVVTKNVPAGVTVVGNPARILS